MVVTICFAYFKGDMVITCVLAPSLEMWSSKADSLKEVLFPINIFIGQLIIFQSGRYYVM